MTEVRRDGKGLDRDSACFIYELSTAYDESEVDSHEGNDGIKWFIMKWFVACNLAVAILASAAVAQEAPTSASSLRSVRGQTIVSNELPPAELTFSKDFRYVGGQRVNLYGMADAEQHIFVQAGSNGVVKRFCWVQFEHRLPGDKHTYDYRLNGTTDIGGLSFVYDVKSWPDLAANEADPPGSDGAAISRLLGEHNLVFPKRAARVRMFHLPTADRRTELMIIYGEALAEETNVPVRAGGVVLDEEAPAAAHMLLQHARRDLTIRRK